MSFLNLLTDNIRHMLQSKSPARRQFAGSDFVVTIGLESRQLLSNQSVLDHDHNTHVDVGYGQYTPEQIAAFESVIADPRLSSQTPPRSANTRTLRSGSFDGIHEPDILTIVIDFKEPTQGNTTDLFGNVISSFDVASFGFSTANFNAVADAIFQEVREDYFSELLGTPANSGTRDLRINFMIGDIGVAPVGISEYYFVQVGTGVSGPHANGTFGVAGGSVVRSETGGPAEVPIGTVVASVFTDNIQAITGLSPSNALSSGNTDFTKYAVSGTLSHEIGHTLSLSHVSKAGSVQPTAGRSPIMGTGALDLPNQDRLTDRQFSLSGFDGEAGNAPRQHIQQLTNAIGLHDIVLSPEISVFNGTTEIVDGIGSVAIGSTSQGGASVTRTLTVRNTGTANLVLQPATISGSGFSIATNFTSGQIVAPGQTTSLVVRLDSTTLGFKSASLSFANNDSNENPFNFTITGIVTATSSAEIDVLSGTTNLVSNVGSVNFGSLAIGSTAVTRQFIIRNSGNAALILQPATLTGSGFVLTQNVTSRQTVAPGGSATISVRMDANLLGAKSGVLTILSNDSDEGSFKVNLVGSVQSAALGSIAGAVFGDTNGDGIANGGEVGIANRTVYMDLNGNGIFDQAGSSTTNVAATGLPRPINNLSTIVAPLTVAGANGNITDVNVQVNIAHPFAPDIEMTLIAPNGQRVALAFDRGGNGSNFTNTIFDDQATTPISGGSAPFTGSFRPEQPLSVLNGINPNGTWGLEITDDYANDAGTLLGWSLNITSAGAAEPSQITGANGEYSFAGLAAGPYQIRQVLPAGWAQTGPANGQPHTITLAAGQNSIGNNFGSRLSAPANNVTILDDGDAGFSVSGNWSTVTSGYGNDRRLANAGDANATASWNFTGLQNGQYRISATWIGAANRASNIPYTVRSTSGSPILLNTTIDQRPNPASFVDGGTNWQTLGTVTIFGNSLLVTATNTTTGLITADAIRLERLGTAVDIVDDGDAGFSTTGNWSSVTTGFGNDRRLAAAGSGTAIATWSFSNLAAGQYRISATWNNPATNRANDAPYSIRETAGGPSLLTTTVNQRLAPSGFSEGGVLWQDLGTVVISGDSLVIRLSNSTTGLVTADAIRIERIS
jgi:subtilisin-like proprotein convertase family protein